MYPVQMQIPGMSYVSSQVPKNIFPLKFWSYGFQNSLTLH